MDKRKFIKVKSLTSHHILPLDLIESISPYNNTGKHESTNKSTITLVNSDTLFHSIEKPSEIYDQIQILS